MSANQQFGADNQSYVLEDDLRTIVQQTGPSSVQHNRLMWLAKELLVTLGQDPNSHGLRETPRRFANWWQEFLQYEAGVLDRDFECAEVDQMVVVSGIRVWSICEHHLLPFWCDVAIGYLPRDRVLGLSKFARVAHKYSHRLQLQERLCQQIADEISDLTGSPDVAVIARGEHLCMTMRGVRSPGIMTTLIRRGVFSTDESIRAEFLGIAG
jgi:GTP cyclohydrolase I